MKITVEKVFENEKTWAVKAGGQIYSYFKRLKDGTNMPIPKEGVVYEITYKTNEKNGKSYNNINHIEEFVESYGARPQNTSDGHKNGISASTKTMIMSYSKDLSVALIASGAIKDYAGAVDSTVFAYHALLKQIREEVE